MQLLGLTISTDLILVFLSFWLLVILGFRHIRINQMNRGLAEWLLDIFSLFNQGLIVPLIATLLLYPLYSSLLPNHVGSLNLPSWVVFLIPLTVIDYLYYWNHRWLHTQAMWPVHRLHHSAKHLDVLMTSRNSAFTPLFIVYLWTHPLFLLLLENPEPYLLGVAASSALDLWRHSSLKTPQWLSPLRAMLITPEEHQLHHSEELVAVNLGANLSLWDRIHGTYRCKVDSYSKEFGESPNKNLLLRLFLFPWGKSL